MRGCRGKGGYREQGQKNRVQGSGRKEKQFTGGAAKEILSWDAKISQGWHYEKE